MIDFAAVKAALQDAMAAVAPGLPVPVTYENAAFDPDGVGAGGYLFFAVVQGRTQGPADERLPETAGARLLGTVHFLAAVAPGTGDGLAEAALSIAAAAFAGKTFTAADGTRIRVQAPAGNAAGRQGNWWQKLVALPFVATPR